MADRLVDVEWQIGTGEAKPADLRSVRLGPLITAACLTHRTQLGILRWWREQVQV